MLLLTILLKAVDLMKKISVEVIETIKDDDEEKEVITTKEFDVVENSPIVKANGNNYPFMDTFISKANDTIKNKVDKMNDKSTYFDTTKNKPKSYETVKQSIKRDNTKVNLLVVLGKLLNKSSLNDDDVDTILDYATYNNKSKTDIVIFDGMLYNDFITKYPRSTVKQIKELCDTYNLTLDFISGKFIAR